MMNGNFLYPDQWCGSAYEIDYEALYEAGYRALLYDIDNTLVPHGAPADAQAEALFSRLHEMGFATCLVSNNQMPRVRPFADAVQSKCIVNAHKPSRGGFEAACRLLRVPAGKAVLIGDQLFTDIWGARRSGIYSILVQPIHPKEEIQIVLKRRIEWPILHRYRRHLMRQGITNLPSGHFQRAGSEKTVEKKR